MKIIIMKKRSIRALIKFKLVMSMDISLKLMG